MNLAKNILFNNRSITKKEDIDLDINISSNKFEFDFLNSQRVFTTQYFYLVSTSPIYTS